jgi:P-type Cu2+ transporter
MTDMAGVRPDLSAFLKTVNGEVRAEFLVRGARCAGCMSKIEKGVLALPGVISARLNLTSGRFAVAWRDKKSADPALVVETLDGLGYPTTPFDPAEAQASVDKEGRRLALALGVAGFGVGNVMMFSVPAWSALFGQEMGDVSRTTMYWLSALVATPCTLYAGQPFFQSAWKALSKGKANMDVPISIGVSLALLISFYQAAIGGRHAYFDAAVSLLFLLLIGRFLDHQLRAKARSAARDLLALQAPVAERLNADGHALGVPVREVQVGDLIVVQPGDRFPVNGVVSEGASDIDASLVTGETRTEPAVEGTRISAGALNLTGRLVLRCTAPADESAVAEIARLMETGAQSKSKYVRLADKAAAIYVPVVHTAAALTFVVGMFFGLDFSEALIRAVAVLIVTCPCALGLAVPAVQITASGRLFRKGVLLKSGAALERLAEVTHVVLDKTGVITAAAPELIDADPAAIARAAPLARASRHPLAKALARAAGPGPAAEGAKEAAGLGVEGQIEGRMARMGRAAYVGAEPAPEGALETELWFRIEGEAPIRFAFREQLRPDAAQAIAGLKARGLSVEILSGDVSAAVEKIAAEVGITTWRAGLTPQEKAAAIRALAESGKKTLMVGDGLNDAAALALAHASMAPGEAANISQNAADLVFTGDSLSATTFAVDVARAARQRALENFAFSALYNLVATPAAMLGLVNPLVAAIAMSSSSLVVTLNALRMTWVGGRR